LLNSNISKIVQAFVVLFLPLYLYLNILSLKVSSDFCKHLFFNLLSYTDENMNIQKSNIDDIVTELSDILMTSAKATFGLKNTRN
jgi:hypothetical protein